MFSPLDSGRRTELAEATKKGTATRPGFVSANLHVSSDRRHVTNYAQWRTQADIDSMMADKDSQAHMQMAADIADSFDLIYYELRDSISKNELS